MSELVVKRVLIIGLGLISGSLMKLIKAKRPDIIIDVVARRQETLDQAAPFIAKQYLRLDLLDTIDHDLVLIGLPMTATIELFDLLKQKITDQTIVTDISSVKASINQQAECISDNYVGGHPLAGSDKSGFENSTADIMDNARYILTTDSDQRKRNVLKEFLSGLGMQVLEMDPVEHDHLVAAISHLPYLTAVSLLNSIDEDELQLASTGLASTTRVAASPVLWGEEIIAYNQTELLGWIERYQQQLELLRIRIQAGENITDLLQQARQKRLSLEQTK